MKTIMKEFVDDEEIEIKGYKSTCPQLIDTKMRYMTIVTIMIIVSIICFIIFATVAYFNPMYTEFGPGILFSRGGALAILVFTIFGMFLVTYDLTTCCRRKLKKRCSTLFDFQILFHRVSGFLITFYSIVHTIGHLTGSIMSIDKEQDLEKTNHVLTHKKFSKHMTYAELLFTTIPGITGILLLIIILAMCITSLECVRRKAFQLFSYTHTLLFPLFIILIIIHGSDTWLNYGFPLGSITVGISLLVYFAFWVKKIILQMRGKLEIDHVEVAQNNSFCFIHLKKPKYYRHYEGQYAFINVPEISFFQWHPFSICSSFKSPYISFLIKSNGDFTLKLVKMIKNSIECGSIKTYHSPFTPTPINMLINLLKRNLSSLEFSRSPTNEQQKDDNKYKNFGIYLSYPVSSPVAQSIFHKNVIYIGTGAGIATFLSFVDKKYFEVANKLSNISILDEDPKNDTCEDLNDGDTVEFVFISRELEHMRWISKYLDAALRIPEMTKNINFHIYITVKPESNNIASFLFWRALNLYNKKCEVEKHRKISLFINLGRPKFEKVIDKLCCKNDIRKHYVYACGPKVMTDEIEKICLKRSQSKDKSIIFNYEIF